MISFFEIEKSFQGYLMFKNQFPLMVINKQTISS
jgi:hypothetical protein